MALLDSIVAINLPCLAVINLGYGRVSKLDLDRTSGDLDVAAQQQMRRLEKAGCTEIFFDIQKGTDDDRPAFERLMARVRGRQCDRVTITRDDRITRNIGMTLQILDLLPKSGVELVILDDGDAPIDLANPYGWKQRVDAGVTSEFEVKMLSLRIRRGYEDLRAERKANPMVPYGYQRSKEGFYELHPVNYAAARWLIETLTEKIRKAKGTIQDEDMPGRVYAGCIFQSCKEFNDLYQSNWDHSRFRRWLINPVLRGHTPRFVSPVTGLAKTCDWDTHPDLAIISKSEDELISELLKVTGQYRGVNQAAKLYPLGGGLCRCDRCNNPMTVTAKKHKSGVIHWYLVCADASSYNRKERCTNAHAIPYWRVEEKAIAALCDAAESIAQLAMTPETEEESQEILSLKRQLLELQKIPGSNPAILKAIADLENQIAIALGGTETKNNDRNFSVDLLRSCGEIAANPDYWNGLSDEDKRSLYHALIREIWIDGAKQPESRFVKYSVAVMLAFV